MKLGLSVRQEYKTEMHISDQRHPLRNIKEKSSILLYEIRKAIWYFKIIKLNLNKFDESACGAIGSASDF